MSNRWSGDKISRRNRDPAVDTSRVLWHGLACIRQAFYHPDLDLTLREERIQRIWPQQLWPIPIPPIPLRFKRILWFLKPKKLLFSTLGNINSKNHGLQNELCWLHNLTLSYLIPWPDIMVSSTTSTAKSNLHPAVNPLLLAYKDAGYIHRKVSNTAKTQ